MSSLKIMDLESEVVELDRDERQQILGGGKKLVIAFFDNGGIAHGYIETSDENAGTVEVVDYSH